MNEYSNIQLVENKEQRKNPQVCVLMSTYNGQKYLKEQVESILNQEGVDVKLIIRDDGSSDNTLNILKTYVKNGHKIVLFAKKNVGVEKSFEILTRYSCLLGEGDYFAYSDQDDIWFTNKLAVAIASIESFSQPALYCSNQIIVDDSLEPQKWIIDAINFEKIVSLMEADYFRNRHGCTMVWNKELNYIYGKVKHNSIYIPCHDRWLNLIARCSGIVVVGKHPHQYYRIHQNNVSGLAINKFSRLKKGIKIYLKQNLYSDLYAQDCLKYLSDLKFQTDGEKYVRIVANYKKNIHSLIKLLCAKQIWNTGVYEGVFRTIRILLGRF